MAAAIFGIAVRASLLHTLRKILTHGLLRSGYQIRPSNPNCIKVCPCRYIRALAVSVRTKTKTLTRGVACAESAAAHIPYGRVPRTAYYMRPSVGGRAVVTQPSVAVQRELPVSGRLLRSGRRAGCRVSRPRTPLAGRPTTSVRTRSRAAVGAGQPCSVFTLSHNAL